MIIGEDGYIVTNNHVVDGAENIEVILNDNRKFTAKVIGRDPNTDIALVKIDAKNLAVLPWEILRRAQAGRVGIGSRKSVQPYFYSYRRDCKCEIQKHRNYEWPDADGVLYSDRCRREPWKQWRGPGERSWGTGWN